jgi:hypothetical protein
MRSMSRLVVSLFSFACVASVVVASRADAQGGGFGTRPTAGIFGGVTLPRGAFSEESDLGWHAGALAKIRVYNFLDVRLDGTYTKLGKKTLKNEDATVEVVTDPSVTFGTLSAVLNLGPDSAAYPGDNTVSPYLVGGLGKYRLDYAATCTGDCGDFADKVETHWGMNVGFGTNVPVAGIRTFFEGRYHRISRSLEGGGTRNMFLVSFGVKFR